MENEIWKDIEGFEGLYQVSNMGRVKNKKQHVLKPQIYDGYFCVGLHKKEFHKIVKIHKLMGIHFLNNKYKEGFVIDHIDGNRTNNSISNLRWVKKSQNEINSKIGRNNKSGYKGVCFDITHNRWLSFWEENGKQKIKRFKTKEEAIEYRRKMVEKYYSKEHYIEDR